jgi:DNA replication and repair protein RecF
VALSRLQIHNIRNLEQVELSGLDRVNVLFGPNGSGKTSVLEAIHILGMARSFRGNSVKSLISHSQQRFTVFGAASSQRHGADVPLGVQRSRDGEIQIKVGGEVVRTVTELVEHLPIQVINADSFELLTGSPRARRQYLDWGVFHVEHRFYGEWQRFQRCIKQRNKLLRHGRIPDQELAVWTRDLIKAGTAINDYRTVYFEQLVPRFQAIFDHLLPTMDEVELRYRKGWDRQLDFGTALENSLGTDCEQGYTHIGPQRADIRVLVGGHLASETLSRGQQKLVVCALKLAQGQLMTETGRGNCTYLVDDLPSELDEQHNRQVCELLASMDSQVFITCVDSQDIADVWPKEAKPAVFHVEQGAVKPVLAIG